MEDFSNTLKIFCKIKIKVIKVEKWRDHYWHWMCKIYKKNGGFFNNCGRFFAKLDKSHQNINVWKGLCPFQYPIAAKSLEASGEAASTKILQ